MPIIIDQQELPNYINNNDIIETINDNYYVSENIEVIKTSINNYKIILIKNNDGVIIQVLFVRVEEKKNNN